MFVCCVGSGLCDVLITLCYWVCVKLIVCELDAPTGKRSGPNLDCRATEKVGVRIANIYLLLTYLLTHSTEQSLS